VPLLLYADLRAIVGRIGSARNCGGYVFAAGGPFDVISQLRARGSVGSSPRRSGSLDPRTGPCPRPASERPPGAEVCLLGVPVDALAGLVSKSGPGDRLDDARDRSWQETAHDRRRVVQR